MKKSNYPYITFELAEQLKEIGFDEQCSAVYERNTFYNPPKIEFITSGNNHKGWNLESFKKCVTWMEEHNKPNFFDRETKNSLLNHFLFAAPLYSEVFDWFYEKHNIFIEHWIKDGNFGYNILYKEPVLDEWILKFKSEITDSSLNEEKEESYISSILRVINFLIKKSF